MGILRRANSHSIIAWTEFSGVHGCSYGSLPARIPMELNRGCCDAWIGPGTARGGLPPSQLLPEFCSLISPPAPRQFVMGSYSFSSSRGEASHSLMFADGEDSATSSTCSARAASLRVQAVAVWFQSLVGSSRPLRNSRPSFECRAATAAGAPAPRQLSKHHRGGPRALTRLVNRLNKLDKRLPFLRPPRASRPSSVVRPVWGIMMPS